MLRPALLTFLLGLSTACSVPEPVQRTPRSRLTYSDVNLDREPRAPTDRVAVFDSAAAVPRGYLFLGNIFTKGTLSDSSTIGEITREAQAIGADAVAIESRQDFVESPAPTNSIGGFPTVGAAGSQVKAGAYYWVFDRPPAQPDSSMGD